MKKLVTIISVFMFITNLVNAQIGINSTNSAPDPSAMLDVNSTAKGLLIPRMTSAQKNAIVNKVEGLTVYDTDLKLFSYWKTTLPLGGTWVDFPQAVSSGSNLWLSNGNDIYNNTIGNVGVGINSPTKKLDVGGNGAFRAASLSNSGNDGGALQLFSNDLGGSASQFLKIDGQRIQSLGSSNSAIVPTPKDLFLNPFGGKLAIGTSIVPSSTLLSLKGNNADGSAVFGGTTYNSYFQYSTTEDTYIRGGKNGSKVIINDGTLGNVGIGLTNPRAKLTILSNVVLANSNTEVFQMAGQNPVMLISDQNGSDWGYIKGVTNNIATPQFPFGGVEIGAPPGLDVYLSTNYGPALTVHHVNNNVGIGITNPSNKLEVNGTIRSKELIVELAGWPDYVFENNYKLNTIDQLESFIKLNKHLPGISSAKEIEKNGLKVGETNKAMMEKIEELALYIIELKREIDLLKKSK